MIALVNFSGNLVLALSKQPNTDASRLCLLTVLFTLDFPTTLPPDPSQIYHLLRDLKSGRSIIAASLRAPIGPFPLNRQAKSPRSLPACAHNKNRVD